MHTLNQTLRNFCSLTIALALVFTLMLPTAAQAVCTWPPPKLCNELFTSDLVVRAKVSKIKNVIDPKDPIGVDAWDYHVDVIKTYRGPALKRQIIRSENASARLLLKQGEEYIIFASKSSDGRYHAGSNCKGIQRINGERYTDVLDAEITALKQLRQASIEIEFRDQKNQLTPFLGASIKSKTGTLPVVPDNNGLFLAIVPPGTYSVSLPKSLEPHSQDYYFVDSEPFKLVAGQCEQLAFVEKAVEK
jgi:Tissue inhibitor of metalloproteinase